MTPYPHNLASISVMIHYLEGDVSPELRAEINRLIAESPAYAQSMEELDHKLIADPAAKGKLLALDGQVGDFLDRIQEEVESEPISTATKSRGNVFSFPVSPQLVAAAFLVLAVAASWLFLTSDQSFETPEHLHSFSHLGGPSAQSPKTELLNKALQAYDQQEYSEAISHLTALLGHQEMAWAGDTLADLQLCLVSAYLKEKQPDKAKTWLNKLYDAQAGKAIFADHLPPYLQSEVMMYKIYTHILLDEREEAEALFRELSPDNPAYETLKGLLEK